MPDEIGILVRRGINVGGRTRLLKVALGAIQSNVGGNRNQSGTPIAWAATGHDGLADTSVRAIELRAGVSPRPIVPPHRALQLDAPSGIGNRGERAEKTLAVPMATRNHRAATARASRSQGLDA